MFTICTSEWRVAGQCSIGSLLFLLFINEIVNNANVNCLQKGINDLCTWAKKWQLKLSVDKCFHLRVGLIKSVLNKCCLYFVWKPAESCQ